jgi:carbamoyl-phosphate synthase/aspartate carbamoyltransferase
LDIYTIREELGTVNGLNITLLGDLKHGRTVHSLVRFLAQYDVRLHFVSPASLAIPEDVREEAKRTVTVSEHEDLNEVIAQTDVLYVTRVQKERFEDLAEYERVANSYRITNATLKKAKANMIIMHPLPRVNEIDPEVDYDNRAAYFRQMRYGLYVRMALLFLIMSTS